MTTRHIGLLRTGRCGEQFITGRTGGRPGGGGLRELIDNKEQNVKILVSPREVLS